MPFEDHGDSRNLIEKNLVHATKTESAEGADITKVKQNIEELIDLERKAGELGNPKEKY